MVLVLGVSGGRGIVSGKEYDGNDEDNSGQADWELGLNGSCWVEIDAHDSVSLGSYGFGSGEGNVSPGDTINSESEGNGNKQVQVKTNCKSDLTTQVYVSSFSLPSDHPNNSDQAIDDFSLKTESGNIDTYQAGNFAESEIGEDSTKTIGTHAGPSTRNYVMNYQYEIDENDVGGSYTVELVYTVTT